MRIPIVVCEFACGFAWFVRRKGAGFALARIFTVLTLVALFAVGGTLMLGFGLRSVDIRDPADNTAQGMATVHRLCGIAASIAVVFVNSIVLVYFIGASRWCKEVSDAYQLDTSLVRRSNALKRRAFPFAVGNMLVVVGIIALGGAGDPAGTFRAAAPFGMAWKELHFAAAAGGLCFIAWASFVIANNIRENHLVVTEVMARVKAIRDERGLP